MRAAFLGTPAAAVPSLAALAGVADVAVVVTRRDRPKGRSGRPTPPPVKTAAVEWGLPVAQPADGRELDTLLTGIRPDVAVVVAYGRILPAATLTLVPRGFVNVHFSLLPRWRGAAPVERAILAGDPVVGVSLMLIDEGLDTGPVIGALETPCGEAETGGELTARLADLGARLVGEVLPAYMAGGVEPAPQLDAAATTAGRLTPIEARLDPADGAAPVLRAIRAFHPRPGAWLLVEGKRLGVLKAGPVEGLDVVEGRIESAGGRVVLGTADGPVELLSVRPEGGTVQSARAWSNGRRGEPAVVDPVDAS